MSTTLIFADGDPPGDGVLDDLPAADLAIAADGGYNHATALGHPVDVIVGDMDSIRSSEIPRRVLVETHSPDKSQTDLELALELAVRDEPMRIIVIGGAGGRHDHELANSHLIASNRWKNVEEIDWLTNRSRTHVVRGRRLIHDDIGTTVSLLATAEGAYGISTRGLKWNLDGDDMVAGHTLGVSNIMSSPVADVKVAVGSLLFVIPTDQP